MSLDVFHLSKIPTKNPTTVQTFPTQKIGILTRTLWQLGGVCPSKLDFYDDMGVSQNRGTPKWMVWMIWGYHYFWKHPYVHIRMDGITVYEDHA